VADMIQINVEFKRNVFCVHDMSLHEYLGRFYGKHLRLLIHLLPHNGIPTCRYLQEVEVDKKNDKYFAYLASVINAHPDYKYHICISDPYCVERLRSHFTKPDVNVSVGVMLSRYNLEQALSVPKGVMQLVSIIDKRILSSLETIKALYERTMVYCYVENDMKMYNVLKDNVHGIIYTPSMPNVV